MFYPPEDGFELVLWAGRRSWSDGKPVNLASLRFAKSVEETSLRFAKSVEETGTGTGTCSSPGLIGSLQK